MSRSEPQSLRRNVGYIWDAPNHVRAFRRSTYEELGGYNAELEFRRPGHIDMQISYVQANLLAIKDGPRQGGPLLC